MKQLKIDYTMSNGHQMTIERTIPFTSRDMNSLEMNMLSANTVHTLLPFDWNEIDNDFVFVYRIQHYKLLTHYYQPRSIGMIDYYSLLLSLLDALATCYDYMLRPQCCLLDEKLIYIDPTTNNIRLVYIPVQELLYKEGHQLLLLAVRWSQLVDRLHYEDYQKILQLLGSEYLPINPLRQLLLDLIHQQSSPSQEELQPMNSEQTKPATAVDNVQNEPESSLEQAPVGFSRVDNDGEYEDWGVEEAEEKTIGMKHYIASLLLAAVIGLAWKMLYIEEATTTNLLLSSGITLILLTGIIIVMKQHWKVLGIRKSNDQMNQYDQSLPSDTNPSNQSSRSPITEHPVKSKPLHIERQARVVSSQATVHLDVQQLTTILGAKGNSGTPSLVRKLYDDEQRIIVNDHRFLIGRAEEGVHYQDAASGVSRVHLEVEVDNGLIHIKDVGSRNGSYLNGQLMIAYKTYPLYEGDIIQLVGNEGPKYQLAI